MTSCHRVDGVATGRRRARGQALVEFAFALPVFLITLFGLVDGGRLVYMNSVLSQAAREGARVAAVEASWLGSSDSSCGTLGGPVCPASLSALKTHALAAANRMVAPFGPISAASIFISCDASGSAPTGSWTGVTCAKSASGNAVSVRIVLSFVPITPVAGQFVAVSLSGSATMVIN